MPDHAKAHAKSKGLPSDGSRRISHQIPQQVELASTSRTWLPAFLVVALLLTVGGALLYRKYRRKFKYSKLPLAVMEMEETDAARRRVGTRLPVFDYTSRTFK